MAKEEAERRGCLTMKAVSDLPLHMSYIKVSKSGLAFFYLYLAFVFHQYSYPT